MVMTLSLHLTLISEDYTGILQDSNVGKMWSFIQREIYCRGRRAGELTSVRLIRNWYFSHKETSRFLKIVFSLSYEKEEIFC